MDLEEARQIVGNKELSITSKMPAFSFGLPVSACITGAKLALVAGSVCSKCYATRGNYTFPHVVQAHMRRLNNLTNPQWVTAMVYMIRHSRKVLRRKGKELDTKFFRWMDSGDLQSVEHLENICEISRRLRGMKFWLPTREYGLVRAWHAQGGVCPENLVIRLSAHMINGPLPVALAEQLNVRMSGVHFKGTPLPKGITECLAYTRGNQCGDCRACWDKRVKAVSYKQH